MTVVKNILSNVMMNGNTWVYNPKTQKKVVVKRDSSRRYYMTEIEGVNESTKLHRVTYDTVCSNLNYLTKHGFKIYY